MIADSHIRLATPEDAADIASLSKVAIEYGLPWGWTPRRVREAIADANTNVAVLRSQGALLAFGIMVYDDDVAHLLLLAVCSTRRRTKLGSALLVWLERVASVAGIVEIRVEARADNTPARAFYRQHGYRELATVTGMYHDVADGVRLLKRPPITPTSA